MNFIKQEIPGLFLIDHDLHKDDRGVFRRTFCKDEFLKAGIDLSVVQGNISENFRKLTLRGFHYQVEPSRESKVITCVSGSIYNVVIDLRDKSPTQYNWQALQIDYDSRNSIVIPAGCANAFLTLDDNTIIHYYMGDSFNPQSYRGFRYDDPKFSVQWPYEPEIISEKDASFEDYLDV